MNGITAFVTAGGESSRMGRDKAWLDLDGHAMIEYVIAALKPVTPRIAIIATSPEYKTLGYPVFTDSHPRIGPLEAVRTGLANADTSRIILVGCDLPLVTSDLFNFLLSVQGDHCAVVPKNAAGRLEPLCAIYCREALAEINTLIDRGERKIGLLFERVPSRIVDNCELEHLEASEFFFENVNAPDDATRAIQILRSLRRS